MDSGVYNQRVAECKMAVEQLNTVRPLKYIAELSEEKFNKIGSVITNLVAFSRAHHVVGEVQLTSDAIAALKAGDIKQFGKLMYASHVSLRDDYRLENTVIDR